MVATLQGHIRLQQHQVRWMAVMLCDAFNKVHGSAQ